MRKNTKLILFFLLMSSVVIPFIPVTANPVTSQAQKLHFRIAVGSLALDWDSPIYAASWADSYRSNSLENMITTRTGWDPKNLDEIIPMLATSWDIEYWPDNETNSFGWKNGGGVKSITWTLRENVTFHDGSQWNATVAKWNFDRIFVITGNLTGNGDVDLAVDSWLNINDVEPYFTNAWNLSWAKGKVGSYNGMVGPGPSNSSNPLWERVPMMNNTQVITPGGVNGGGVFKTEFNDWNPFWALKWFSSRPNSPYLIASMAAYAEDYTDTPFRGYGSGSLIGTGPWVFVHHTTTGPTTGGQQIKNYNYWNATNLEADGWFEIDYIDSVVFPDDGKDARNTAFYTGALDSIWVGAGWEIDFATVEADPNYVVYTSDIGRKYPETITLSCINETYWKTTVDMYGDSAVAIAGAVGTDGIPRLFRKAISYAFDYDGYIQTAHNGRAFRSTSFMGTNSSYTNENIPMPYLNLTIAREAMLSQFPSECDARGLNSSNIDNDALWQSVAASNPIFKVNMYWDIGVTHLLIKDYMITGLANIGCSYWLDHPNDSFPSNELSSVWSAINSFAFPFFTAQVTIGMDWQMDDDYGVHRYIAAYFKNPGDWSYDTSWNAAFTYQDNVTSWIDEFVYANDTRKQGIMDLLSTNMQTYQYPMMWLCETWEGEVYSADWEMDLSLYKDSHPATMIRYVGDEDGDDDVLPPIPGYPVGIFLGISIATMFGIIYALKRKKKIV